MKVARLGRLVVPFCCIILSTNMLAQSAQARKVTHIRVDEFLDKDIGYDETYRIEGGILRPRSDVRIRNTGILELSDGDLIGFPPGRKPRITIERGGKLEITGQGRRNIENIRIEVLSGGTVTWRALDPVSSSNIRIENKAGGQVAFLGDKITLDGDLVSAGHICVSPDPSDACPPPPDSTPEVPSSETSQTSAAPSEQTAVNTSEPQSTDIKILADPTLITVSGSLTLSGGTYTVTIKRTSIDPPAISYGQLDMGTRSANITGARLYVKMEPPDLIPPSGLAYAFHIILAQSFVLNTTTNSKDFIRPINGPTFFQYTPDVAHPHPAGSRKCYLIMRP